MGQSYMSDGKEEEAEEEKEPAQQEENDGEEEEVVEEEGDDEEEEEEEAMVGEAKIEPPQQQEDVDGEDGEEVVEAERSRKRSGDATSEQPEPQTKQSKSDSDRPVTDQILNDPSPLQQLPASQQNHSDTEGLAQIPLQTDPSPSHQLPASQQSNQDPEGPASDSLQAIPSPLQQLPTSQQSPESEEPAPDSIQANPQPPPPQQLPASQQNPESSDSPQANPQPPPLQRRPTSQQPRVWNRFFARSERGQHVHLLIHRVLPSMVNRLRDICRRSSVGAMTHIRLVQRGSELFYLCPPLPPKYPPDQSLSRRLANLYFSAKDLESHVKGIRCVRNPGDDQMALIAQWLRRVTMCLMVLAEEHRTTANGPPYTDDEANQLRCIDEIRLIIYGSIFTDIRQSEPPLDVQFNDREATPIRDAWELIKLIGNELSLAIDVTEDLNAWLSGYTPPPPGAPAVVPPAGRNGQTIREDALELVDRINQFCIQTLAEQTQFLKDRSRKAQTALWKVADANRMEDLNTHESTACTLWRKHARTLAEHCSQLLAFVQMNISVLEQ